MDNEIVTTPFGRRRMTSAAIQAQYRNATIRDGKCIDKWKVYRDTCDARERLGLRDRALAVLNALLSFYPKNELTKEENLVVFPSNAQLIARANGIAGTTLRENLAVLVHAGLIKRNDSPNGKRYVRRNSDGDVQAVYGFSLAPLLARSDELALLAQQVAADRHRLKLIKEQITIARRDICKLISVAIEEQMNGDWETLKSNYAEVIVGLRTARTVVDLQSILDKLKRIRHNVLKSLEFKEYSEKTDTNGGGIRHHIQNSNTESKPESEPCSEEEQSSTAAQNTKIRADTLKSLPIGLVLRACPEIVAYAPSGEVRGWRDLMSAAVVVRSMLGVSASAYEEACEAMGGENAAIVMAAILERANHISSAGGYLRSLTSRTRRGEFSLGPMVMALLRINPCAEKGCQELSS